jgi:hypothetical protein
VVALVGLLSACGAPEPTEPSSHAYLDDRAFRRRELIASLTTTDNEYAADRLTHYATGDGNDWDALPVFNPEATPLSSNDLDPTTGVTASALARAGTPFVLPDASAIDDLGLVRLGGLAFFGYPVEPLPLPATLLTPARANELGLWQSAEHGVGGLVLVRADDGSVHPFMTCATCHAAPDADGNVAPGLPNGALDVGAMLGGGASASDPAAAPFLAWGPGRVDVMTSDGSLPVRIPDLRPTRFLTHLHADATVIQRDLAALAIRIETLLVGTAADVSRPPRLVTLALASYVTSLAATLPAAPSEPAVFRDECARCHDGPGLTGAPRPLDVVGTDSAVGLSVERGTGFYRVPSLRGVSTRGPLLHDGTIATLADLFDASRLDDGYTNARHRPGPVLGHEFGLDLAASDHDALLGYLQAL